MTYEYKCEYCDHMWEEQHGISDEPVKVCPKCKKESAKRLISGGTSFVLKGGGWASSGYNG